jgi:hypothetical protein
MADISWIDRVSLILPRFLVGFTTRDWLRVLRDHGWNVDVVFWPRAALASLGTLVTTILKPFDDARRFRAHDEAAWQRPVFVIGHARSGTTYLFHLLTRDARFGHATRLDVFHPHTFLTLRAIGLHRVLGLLPVRSRAMDAVKVGWLSPDEDSIALAILAGRGDRMQSIFCRTAAGSEMPAEMFRSALTWFTRKLVHLNRKPLILKSPGHIQRIQDILHVFPDARFVAIFREPEAVVASIVAMHQSAAKFWSALQWPPSRNTAAIVDRLADSLNRYFDTRPMIPPQNLVEVRYEDLVADERGTLALIYRSLNLLPPAVPDNPRKKRPYSRRNNPPLDADMQASVRHAFRRLFEAGWYPEPLSATE